MAKASEIRDALYEAFERRMKDVVTRRRELDEEIQQLRKDFRPDIVDEYLGLNQAGGKEDTVAKVRRGRGKRRRRSGGDTGWPLAKQHLPAAIETLKKSGKEFSTNDAVKVLHKAGGAPAKVVEAKHVSLLLSKSYKELGLVLEQRIVEGKKRNFYRVKGKK